MAKLVSGPPEGGHRRDHRRAPAPSPCAPVRIRHDCVHHVRALRRALRPRLGAVRTGRPLGDPARLPRPRGHVSVLRGQHVHDPDPGCVPQHLDRRGDADLHHDGARPQCRGGLRRPARPRLRRLLRARCLHVRGARLPAVRKEHDPVRVDRRRQDHRRRPHLDLAPAGRRRHLHGADRHADRATDLAVARGLSRHRHAGLR